MLCVRFLKLNEEGEQTEASRILWDGSRFTARPDSHLTRNVLRMPIVAPAEDGPRELTAKDGEAFLHGLQFHYANIYLMATAPEEDQDAPLSLDAFLAHDVFSRRAQGVLNRAVAGMKKLSAEARCDLKAALAQTEAGAIGQAIVAFIDSYRTQLTRLLGSTQLAALLAGAQETAKNMPPIPLPGLGRPPPPSLPPDKALKLLAKLEDLPERERALAIDKLPADQQEYIRRTLALGGTRPPLPPFTPPAPPAGSPEEIHFPIIEEAVRDLTARNVLPRAAYDQLDAATRAKAFTVAGVETQETLTRIRDALAETVAEGADVEAFRAKVMATVEPNTFLSDYHMEQVLRNNANAAFSDGQMAVLNQPFVRSGFPYASLEPIDDPRVRPEHLAMAKRGIQGTNVFRVNDPVFQTFRGPWDFGCRCGFNILSIDQAAERGVAEAAEWLRTGMEPSPPAFVAWPPFRPPPEFQRALAGAPLSIRLAWSPLDLADVWKSMRNADAAPSDDLDEALWLVCQALIPAVKPPTLPWPIGQIDGKRIVLVDGAKVKLAPDAPSSNAVHMDFVEAANWLVDDYIPDRTIWVDATAEWRVLPANLYHECIETRIMQQEGASYDKAHERAIAVERELRQRATPPEQESFALESRCGTEPPGPGWQYQGDATWIRWGRAVVPSPTKGKPRIAVVGGGPSGLFAAYILNQRWPKAGVVIFEATPRLGGKIRTDHFSDGTPFEAGVAELYEYQGPGNEDPLRRLIEDDLELPTVNMAGGAVHLRGKLVRDLDEVRREFGEATSRDIERFHKRMVELMPLEKYAHRWQPDPEHPWSDKTFHDAIREEMKDEAAIAYVETAVHTDLATEPWTCNGLNGIKNVLLDNPDYMQLYHVKGGIERIVEELSKKLKADVRLNTRIRAVRKAGDLYEVEFDEQKDQFDAVILAMPNHWLRQIHFADPTLRDAVHQFLIHYDLPAHYLRVSFCFRERWWKKEKIPGDYWMSDQLNGVCFYDESQRWRSEKGHVLSALIAGQDALNMVSSNQSNADLACAVLDSLPSEWREKAMESLIESRVDKYIGSINAQPGGWPPEELVGEHQLEPKKHPGLVLVADEIFDSTINACLISAGTAVNLLIQHFGLKAAAGTAAVKAVTPARNEPL